MAVASVMRQPSIFNQRGGTEQTMAIHESGEDYLESILKLKEERGQVRSIDIVADLGFSKPSVSIAMKRLRESGYIEMAPDGYITLTESGQAVAEHIYTRHKALKAFFMALGVNEKTAAADACKVEHDLSEETFQKLCEHAENHLRGSIPGKVDN